MYKRQVLKHFLDSDLKEIRIFSRDEKKQDDMRHELQANHPQYAGKGGTLSVDSAVGKGSTFVIKFNV